jgi:ferredoxin-NADP reductase
MLMSKEQSEGHNPERIVVQVSKDGSYNKRVEKVQSGDRVNVQATVGNLKGNTRDHLAQSSSGMSGKATKPILKKK